MELAPEQLDPRFDCFRHVPYAIRKQRFHELPKRPILTLNCLEFLFAETHTELLLEFQESVEVVAVIAASHDQEQRIVRDKMAVG